MKTAITFNKKANEFFFLGTDLAWHPTQYFGWFQPETEKFGGRGLQAPLEYYFVNCSSWDEQFINDIPLHIANDLHSQLAEAADRLHRLESWASRGATKSLLSDLVETGDIVRRLTEILEPEQREEDEPLDGLDSDGNPVKYGVWRAE